MKNSIVEWNDQQLAASIGQGDQQALHVIYDRYAPALFGIISRIANDKLLAEEVLTKVFLNIGSKVGSFNPIMSSFFTWLINLTRQITFDMIKSHSNKNPNNNNNVNKPVGNNNSGNSVFELLFYHGLSIAETGAVLGMTEEEVKQNLAKSLKERTEKSVKA